MKNLDFAKKENNLLYIDKPELNCSIGIAAKNCNTVNYEQNLHKIRKFEKYLIHFETSISPDKIFFLNQKHEDRIVKTESTVDAKDLFFAEADAMITSKKGFCLVIRTADCIPVMISDPVQNCVAAIHSGWRSTEKNIVGKTVDRMKQDYGSNPSDLIVFLLPGIGADYYEVSNDVASKFEGHYSVKEDSCYLDLKSVIRTQLLGAGCIESKIFNSYQDTYGFNDVFFSHRKGDVGRDLNYIYLN